MAYIRFPIETDPRQLSEDVFSDIRVTYPNWTPNEANLDVRIIRAYAAKAAEIRDLASDVQDDIFRYFGATLMGVPPLDASYATANTTWTMIDNAGHTIPAGTAVAITNGAGDSFVFLTTTSITVAPGSTVTAAGEVLISALEGGDQYNELGGVGTAIQLVDQLDFVSGVVTTAATSGGVDAESDSDYLGRLTRRLHRLSQRPVVPQDFADAALDVSAEVERALASDLYNPLHNLLTSNDADLETDVSGWLNGGNVTLASTGVVAANGAKSGSMTSIAAGDMITMEGAYKAVLPNDLVTALASVRSAVSARNFRIELYWYDNTNTLLAGSDGHTYGATVADVVGAWTVNSVTGSAPLGAAFVRPAIRVLATGGASEVHYWDKILLRRNAITTWVPGGTAEVGVPYTISVYPLKSDGTPVSAPTKALLQAYYDANRLLNNVVYVVDPIYVSINVAATVIVSNGYDATLVHDAVVDAITNYLSPANWAIDQNATGSEAQRTWVQSSKLYYNELIALISNVSGVYRVSALTMNEASSSPGVADIPLPLPASLTTPGAITVTTA